MAPDNIDPQPGPIAWPFPLLALVDQCARDQARFWSKLAGSHEPSEAVRAQVDLASSLASDLWAAWLNALYIPLRVSEALADPELTDAAAPAAGRRQ